MYLVSVVSDNQSTVDGGFRSVPVMTVRVKMSIKKVICSVRVRIRV